MMRWFTLILLAFALLSPAHATDDELAMEQWATGRHEGALAIWTQQAKSGDKDALYNLAQAFRLGIGVEANPRAALGLYKKAAEAGHPRAMEQIGLLLYKLPERRPESFRYLEHAAAAGGMRAHYILGIERAIGQSLPRDLALAMLHLQRAADAGIASARAPLARVRLEMTFADKSRAFAIEAAVTDR